MFSFLKFFKKRKASNEPVKRFLSVGSLLNLNDWTIPDDTFERKETIINKSGRLETVYVKKLDTKLRNLFSTIEVRFGMNQKDMMISFFNEDTDSIEPDDLEKLVNDCYNVYGKDNSHTPRGIFDKIDKAAIKRKSWAGRLWIKSTYQPGIILSMDIEGLELTVLSV